VALRERGSRSELPETALERCARSRRLLRRMLRRARAGLLGAHARSRRLSRRSSRSAAPRCVPPARRHARAARRRRDSVAHAAAPRGARSRLVVRKQGFALRQRCLEGAHWQRRLRRRWARAWRH
jgi:hypothetical protein